MSDTTAISCPFCEELVIVSFRENGGIVLHRKPVCIEYESHDADAFLNLVIETLKAERLKQQ